MEEHIAQQKERSPLEERLAQVVLESITEINGLDAFFSYISNNQKVITYCYEKGIITDDEIEEALEGMVLAQARKDYTWMRANKRNYPDHCTSKECFAYALGRGGCFTDKEKKQIPFDQEETIQEYIEMYGSPTLLADLRKKMIALAAQEKREYTNAIRTLILCNKVV